jgi:hypothetical protein
MVTPREPAKLICANVRYAAFGHTPKVIIDRPSKE